MRKVLFEVLRLQSVLFSGVIKQDFKYDKDEVMKRFGGN